MSKPTRTPPPQPETVEFCSDTLCLGNLDQSVNVELLRDLFPSATECNLKVDCTGHYTSTSTSHQSTVECWALINFPSSSKCKEVLWVTAAASSVLFPSPIASLTAMSTTTVNQWQKKRWSIDINGKRCWVRQATIKEKMKILKRKRIEEVEEGGGEGGGGGEEGEGGGGGGETQLFKKRRKNQKQKEQKQQYEQREAEEEAEGGETEGEVEKGEGGGGEVEGLQQLKNPEKKDLEPFYKWLDTIQDILNHKFYSIDFEAYYSTKTIAYPCEIGISEFTLLEGETRYYHTLIDPRPMPPGKSQTSSWYTTKKIHGIFMQKLKPHHRNLASIWKEIVEFTGNKGYIIAKAPAMERLCLAWLAQKGSSKNHLKVQDVDEIIPYLHQRLLSSYLDKGTSLPLYKNLMTNDRTVVNPANCDFHRGCLNYHCALADARNVGKCMNVLCENFNVVPKLQSYWRVMDQSFSLSNTRGISGRIMRTKSAPFVTIKKKKTTSYSSANHGSIDGGRFITLRDYGEGGEGNSSTTPRKKNWRDKIQKSSIKKKSL